MRLIPAMTIRQKLILNNATLMLAIVFVAVMACVKLADLSELMEKNTSTITTISDLVATVTDIELNATAINAMSSDQYDIKEEIEKNCTCFEKVREIIPLLPNNDGIVTALAPYEEGILSVYRLIEKENYLDATALKNEITEKGFYKSLERLSRDRASEQILNIRESTKKTQRSAWFMLISASIASIVVALIIAYWIVMSITKGISHMSLGIKEVGEGDLSSRIRITGSDELGDLATWFNAFVERLQGIIKDIVAKAEVLNTSSSGLSALSRQMASSADEMTSQSGAVASTTEEVSATISTMASAAEEMSANVGTVSSTAEQMSQGMNAVALSIEEMSVAINDIAAGARQGADVSEKATDLSDSATKSMNVLGNAAKEIGEVTALIKRIAEQTNLLALNATIEAASAGDAGKGFAVVANEIKELANQSAQAAEDIARRINGVQTNTEEAVKVIADVSAIINNMNESSSAITNSVEQQRTMANEIAGNVRQVNNGIGEIASSIAEIAKGANDMARSAAEGAGGVAEVSSNIQGISKAAGDSNTGAQQVSSSAGELAKIAEQIRTMIGRFNLESA
ncbi:MAG: methyl-accepting chemotaxis protein [Thermodesulfobacteriota bacterium]|nr:methyl-accepting chemotaxis protein [Thermodesulfobacteriota bacterium]